MPAHFTLQLDTTPPRLELGRPSLVAGHLTALYSVDETCEIEAYFESDTGELIPLAIHPTVLDAEIPVGVAKTGRFYVSAIDLVWNEIEYDFRVNLQQELNLKQPRPGRFEIGKLGGQSAESRGAVEGTSDAGLDEGEHGLVEHGHAGHLARDKI